MKFKDLSYIWFSSTVRLPSHQTGTICFRNKIIYVKANYPLVTLSSSSNLSYEIHVPDGCITTDNHTGLATTTYTNPTPLISGAGTFSTIVGDNCIQGDTFLSAVGYNVPSWLRRSLFKVKVTWKGVWETSGGLARKVAW